MPKWVCVNCGASMNVKESHIGTEQACVNCGKRSEVLIANPFTEILRDEDDAQPDGLQAVDVSPAKSTEEPVSRFARSVLTFSIVGCGGIVLLSLPAVDSVPVAVGMLAAVVGMVLQAVLIWPFYTMVDDTRVNRRLLEELLKRQSA